jgi:hypothetical protein
VPALADIYNAALAHVGEVSTTIADPDTDKSTAARACNRAYPFARDARLASADWGFASTFVIPTALTLASRPPDWAFAYRYPPDCVAYRGVRPYPTAQRPFPSMRASLPTDDGRSFVQVVLCNAPSPYLVYTRRVVETDFPAPFVEALVWRLAVSLAMALGRSETIRQTAEKMAQVRLSEAMAASMREQPIPPFPDSPMIAGRDGSGEVTLPGDDPSRWLGWRADDIRRV